MNKKGFTLIELLLYIGLFAIVSLLIGRQFNALVGNYTTGKNISRQQTDTRDVFGLMVREIRNTGMKNYLTGTTTLAKVTQPGIVVNAASDLSSFNHTQQNGTNYDALEFFKISLDASGNYDCSDTIKYYIDGTTLRRDLKSSKNPNHTNSVVAENVIALQFHYGVLGTNDSLIKQIPLTTPSASWTSGGTTPSYSTNTITIAPTASATGYLKYGTSFTVYTNRKYSVSLQIDPTGGFPANITWLKISLQNSTRTTIYGSETFKPYTPGATMTLTVPVNTGSTASVPAYANLDYSTGGAGTLVVKGMVVRCTELGAYSWVDNPTVAEKVNVRAVKMFVLTRTKDKAKTGNLTDITVGTLPPIARSGDYAWRLFTETIETPNNGVF